MRWLDFISNIIGSVAWPITIVVIVFLLRDSIGELIRLLNKFKYGELEVEFGEDVQAAEKSANESLPDLEESRDQVGVRERIMKIIPISPKTAIIEAWRNLESIAVEASNKANIKLTDTILRKPIHIGRALHKQGIIDEESKLLFKKLRQLRNEAVHHDKMVVTSEEAFSYLNTSIKLAQSMRSSAIEKKSHTRAN